MVQNIPLAIALAIVASIGFAGSAAIQHYAVGETVEKRKQQTMNLAAMWRLVRTPRWLLGLGVAGVAAILHVVALTLGPVSVVQPVGILAVPWSVLLAAKIYKHQVPKRVWLWVGITLTALTLFTVLTSQHASADVQLHETSLLIAIAITAALSLVLSAAGHSGPKAFRCLAWASAGAVLYGLASSLVRVVAEWLTRHEWGGNGVFWICVAVLIISYAGGGWMIQQGYANGPAETVVGAMTSIDPVIAVVVGLVVLGEGAKLGFGVGATMSLLGVISILGIVLLSHDHPEAVEQRARLARQAAAQAAQQSGTDDETSATS